MAASQRIFGGVIVATKYDWGDGNKTHSISLKTHQKNAVAKKQAVSDQQYDWTNPLTPDQVKSAVQSAVGAKYGAPESDLSTQIGQSQQTANTDIPAWYQSYITALQGAQGQASQAYASAQQQITPAAPTGDPVADAANAQRSALANSFQGMQRTIGANTAANYGSQIAQAPLLQIGSQAQQGKQTSDLQRQLSNMKLESGDYGNTVLQGLRQDQQTYNTNQTAAEAAAVAAGVDQDQFNQTEADKRVDQDQNQQQIDNAQSNAAAKQTAADNSRSAQYYGHTKAQYNAANAAQIRKWKTQWESTNGKASKPKYTSSELNTIRKKSSGELSKAQDASDQYDYYYSQPYDPDGPKGPQKPQTHNNQQAVHQVAAHYSTDELTVGRALKRYNESGKKFTNDEIAAAHRIGINIPRAYLNGYGPSTISNAKPYTDNQYPANG